MKQRHQTHPPRTVRNESGAIDLAVKTGQPAHTERSKGSLRNLRLRRNDRGDFLVFKTRDGEEFNLNLDCQDEYGFEAKRILAQWAEEQE